MSNQVLDLNLGAILDPKIDMNEIQYPLVPSPIDERDHDFAMYANAYMGVDSTMPEYEGIEPEIYNQGRTLMCAAFTLATVKYIHELKERGVGIRFSPAYIYANRVTKEYVSEGMILRNAIADLRSYGTVEFDKFPHLGTYPELRAKLDEVVEVLLPIAIPQRVSAYFKLTNVTDIKKAIVRDGAVACGYMLYSSFMAPITVGTLKGVIPTPAVGEKVEGGHAMTIIGWKMINNKLHWKVANSWGTAWGDRGFCYIPADYNGYSEFWAITDAKPEPFVPITISMTLGQKSVSIYRAGVFEEVILDVPATAIDGRTMLPVKFIAGIFGLKASWFPAQRMVYLSNVETDLPTTGINGEVGIPLE